MYAIWEWITAGSLWVTVTKIFIAVVVVSFGIFIIYLAVRAGAVAWFKTKREYEMDLPPDDLLREFEPEVNHEEK